MAKDPIVRISLSDLTALRNRISFLEERLRQYEEPEQKVVLLDKDGRPNNAFHHPLAKTGPKSVLERFPDSFTLEYAEENGANNNMIRNWKYRGYVTEEDGKFKKTLRYINKLEQGCLVRLEEYTNGILC